MTSHRDDDALGWAGDDDPTHASGSGPAEPEREPGPGSEPGREPGSAPGTAPGREPGSEPGSNLEPTAEPAAEPTAEPAPERTDIPDGWSVAGPTAAVEAEAARAAAVPTSSVTLIALGILAGVYLLYTIGWYLGVARTDNPLTDPVARFMFSLGLWLAVAAPAVWFGATFWLTVAKPRARIGWLLAGAVLLVPLPFVLGAGGIS